MGGRPFCFAAVGCEGFVGSEVEVLGETLIDPFGTNLSIVLEGCVDLKGCVEISFGEKIFHRPTKAEDKAVDFTAEEIHVGIIKRFGKCLDDFAAVERIHIFAKVMARVDGIYHPACLGSHFFGLLELSICRGL